MAEAKSDPVFPEIGTANAEWAVFDGKALSPQAGMKLLQESPRVRVIGVPAGAERAMLLLGGQYKPTNELCCGRAVFQKAEDPALFMEYNDAASSWQIKRAGSKGTSSCLAQQKSTLLSPAPPSQANLPSWVLADGALPLTGVACVAVCTLFSLNTDTSSTWSRDNDDSDMLIVGVGGQMRALFEGTYSVTSEACGDALVYNKTQNRDIWLEFSPRKAAGSWQLKTTAARGSNKSAAEVLAPASSPSDPLPLSARNGAAGVWEVSVGPAFKPMPTMHIMPLPISVHVLCAQGPRAAQLNGTFDPVSDVCDGMVVYKKRGNPDMWLEFNMAKKSWMLKPTQDRGQASSWANVACDSITPPEQCKGTFHVYDDSLGWHAQPTMQLFPLSSSVQVAGVQGSHAADVNAQFDPADEVSGGMVCYRRRDNPDVVMEYNLSMKSWLLKHSRDKGQPKAWLYYTSLLRLPPDECVLLTVPGKGVGSWQVMNEGKWQEQQSITLRACAGVAV
jgi:hypothetical protein